MQNLGVNEAADAIRGKFFADRSFRGDPEAAHGIRFVKDVAKALGAGDDPADVMHIAQLLREEGIALHAGQEYPKYVTRKWDNTSHVAQDERDADRIINEPPPVIADQPRVVDGPVQNLSLDLKDQVPHSVGSDHPAGRVPSAVTNREAAQDAYARQPVEGQDRDAAETAYVGRTTHGAAELHDNLGYGDGDEVHVEDLAPTGSKAEGGAPYAKPADVGVVAHDDPDRDGIAGQDVNPTHDSVAGTEEPQHRSGDSSAGKTDTAAAARRPVGNRRPE